MEIRPVNKYDCFADISAVYEQSWKYAYRGIIPQDYLDGIPSGRWINGINKNGRTDVIALDGDRIVGAAAFCPSRLAKYSGWGEIVSLYLLPGYMGRGIGKALFGYCTAQLEQFGYDRIFLWVLEENRRARRFYEGQGFICTDELIEDNIGGRELREIMYIRRK
ncbi:MAG: GNAT family N-acetyltransferase [Ruminococcus sp.]|nr:GNAT family N-acetyltransferase [Ruminococcus sp.]